MPDGMGGLFRRPRMMLLRKLSLPQELLRTHNQWRDHGGDELPAHHADVIADIAVLDPRRLIRLPPQLLILSRVRTFRLHEPDAPGGVGALAVHCSEEPCPGPEDENVVRAGEGIG